MDDPDLGITVTEVGTLIDQLRWEFKIFGEDMISLKKDVKTTKEMVTRNTEDIVLIKVAVKNMVAKIEALTKSIDRLVKTKADREDIQALEKRISILETKVASISR